MRWLHRRFHLDEHDTTVGREVVAGLTTFLAMAYVAVVNPAILSEAGMDFGAVFVATCLAAAFGTLVMGLYANYPIAVAPGMGQNAELHLQAGRLDIPTFAGGGKADHIIYTLQHASGWKYGDVFFFVDVLDSEESGFQDFDVYGEAYANLSLGKMAGKPVGFGPVSDVGLIGGVNWAADPNVRKHAAGVRLSLSLPGFAFANLDVMALADDSEGIASGGAPAEDDTVLVDFNFARPFRIGDADFGIEGHIEYVGERANELGGKAEAWILAQPQLQWRVNDRIAIGIEYQFWMNKLGDGSTDESAIQALLVWEF